MSEVLAWGALAPRVQTPVRLGPMAPRHRELSFCSILLLTIKACFGEGAETSTRGAYAPSKAAVYTVS
jgi:hypothetical protein